MISALDGLITTYWYAASFLVLLVLAGDDGVFELDVAQVQDGSQNFEDLVLFRVRKAQDGEGV